MMKAVLISIRPEWCGQILIGKKTLEIRKDYPKLKPPFKCYIYMTKGNICYPKKVDGKKSCWHNQRGQSVIAEFTCDQINPIRFMYYDGLVDYIDCKMSCLSAREICNYAGRQRPLYGWRISDLKIYDHPKDIKEFSGLKEIYEGFELRQMERAPQSWCYVKEVV